MSYSRSMKTTLADFTDRVNAWNETLSDVVAPFGQAQYVDSHIVLSETNPLFGRVVYGVEPNQNAQGQLGARLKFPASWVFSPDTADCTPEIRTSILNYKFNQSAREESMLWRLREGTILRAVMTDKYSRYDHATLWNAVTDGVNKSGLAQLAPVVFRPYVDDKMTAYIIFPTVDASDPQTDNPQTGEGRRGKGGMHPAIYVSNAEDGTGSTRLAGGLYQSVCENGCIFGWKSESAINIRHRGHSDAEMAYAVSVAIVEAMKSASLGIEQYVNACKIQIESEMIPQLIDGWKSQFKVSENITDEWSKMMVTQSSVHGLTLADTVNGLTLIAGAQANNAVREDLEIAAGEILLNPPARVLRTNRR